MEGFFKQIKFIEQKDKDAVSGYVHKSQTQLPVDQPYYTIPSLIIYGILYYFYDPERFDECCKGLELNEDKTIVTHTASTGDWKSVYGKTSIPADSKYIYEWQFKILQRPGNGYGHHLFGIHSFTNTNKIIDNDFSCSLMHKNSGFNESEFYAICDTGDKYNNREYDIQFGAKWEAGDVITMILDMNKRTLSYRRNKSDFGVAFEDMVFYGETFMAIAMGKNGLSIELTSFSVQ